MSLYKFLRKYVGIRGEIVELRLIKPVREKPHFCGHIENIKLSDLSRNVEQIYVRDGFLSIELGDEYEQL